MEKVISEAIGCHESMEEKLNAAFKEGFCINYTEVVGDGYFAYLVKREKEEGVFGGRRRRLRKRGN